MFYKAQGFNFKEVQLIKFFFFPRDCAFGVVLKKSLSYTGSSKFSSMLSSSFIVLHFTFMSAINFELIFCE